MSDQGLRELARTMVREAICELRNEPVLPLRWLTPERAATYLGISPRALEDWRAGRGGPGPAFTRAGRLVRYKLEDLDAFMEGGRQ